MRSFGWDWYSAQGVMSIVRPFHKSRVVKKFPLIPVKQLKRELEEQIDGAREKDGARTGCR